MIQGIKMSNFPPNNIANNSEDLYVCPDRVSPGDEPRDITAVKDLYVPFDGSNKAVHLQKKSIWIGHV